MRRNPCALRVGASAATGVPIEVHLPGWEPAWGHRVLDILEQEGADYAIPCCAI